LNEIRVRFAPSPTGYLHIGGARTALFNWLYARQNHGRLVLRIEDTDTERLKEDSVAQILTSLKWLGLDWDEGPFYQSERLDIYQREAERLVHEGKAYYCFCSPEELDQVREGQRQAGEAFRYNRKCREIAPEVAEKRIAAGEKAVVRLKIPENGTITVTDLVRGEVAFSCDQLDDLVILKSNGMPAYNFACVVDDHAMAISHVIRAEEHLPNTPKQVLLYEALGYELVQFAHVAMILAPDRSKLSKRHGATSVEEFREQGFLAPAIVNYLTLLGWSPGDAQEIFPLAESVEKFQLDKVAKTAAIYDTKKLTWVNGQYMVSMDLDEVIREAIPFFVSKGLIGQQQVEERFAEIRAIVGVVRDRVKTLVDLADAAEYFFLDVAEYEEKGRNKYFSSPIVAERLRQAIARLEPLAIFDAEHVEAVYQNLIEELGIKAGELIHPTRLALTGRTMSPGLYDVMAVLGKERCLTRLERAANFIDNEK
jgi:glutamyl-tRNA synthetase